MRVIVVTGTDTGVGKTVVTAALARAYTDAGLRVSVVKPTQTGVAPGDPGDVDEVARLGGVSDVHEIVRLRDPLAPDTAARREQVRLPTVTEHAAYVAALDADLVLVEGAGGLLVRLDGAGHTLADLACALQSTGLPVTTVVVTRSGLGTLNHTALTADALRARGIPAAGLVIGAWPGRPGLADHCNREELASASGLRLLATLPQGAGRLAPGAFARVVRESFSSLP